MKSVLIVALAGSAAAAPSFGSFLDALFGGSDKSNAPSRSDYSNYPPIGTGSGVPFPFPSATGASSPTGSSGALPSSFPGSDSKVKREAKALHIDYRLAPKRELKYRQLGGAALPSFSLLDPNETPTATESATGLPTELPTEPPGLPTGTGAPELPTGIPTDLPGLPTGFPTPPAGGPTAPFPFPTGEAPFPTDAPFPTAPAGTGLPGLPTTLETLTRGPRPTAAPEAPAGEGEEMENGNGWMEWISDLLKGGKGAQN